MKYLRFDTSTGAEERSRELWAQNIGSDPEPDATSHLYLHAKNQSESFLYVSDDGDLLTEGERSSLIDEDEFNEWVEQNEEAAEGS